jgi:hypothetical protein
MNWLERARREISEIRQRPTANTADRTLTAVTAVLCPAPLEESAASIGSNGSTAAARMPEIEALREAFEERAAIMEFDGGLRAATRPSRRHGRSSLSAIGCTDGNEHGSR